MADVPQTTPEPFEQTICAWCEGECVCRERREDRAYRDGYMQAFREWCAYEADGFREIDRQRLEQSRQAVQRRAT